MTKSGKSVQVRGTKEAGSVAFKNSKAQIRTHGHEKTIMEINPGKYRGGSIGNLISSRVYIYQESRISELVDALNQRSDISAVGVVDENLKVKGIIVRKDLFNMLGRPYGKEVLEHKHIVDLMGSEHLGDVIIEVKVFDDCRNVFSLIPDLGEDFQTERIERYLLVDGAKKFAGIVTNVNILIYLSAITQKDIQMAQKLQSSIVKGEKEIHTSRMEMAGISKMAKGVGGDFYDMLEFKEKNWLLSLCDVSGKGVSAALVTGILGGVKSMYDFRVSVTEFIRRLNSYMYHSFQTEKYLTGVFVKVEEGTGFVKIYDMGHSLVYIYRQGELFKVKTSDNNLPLGIQPDIEVKPTGFHLKKDDILFIFTDGVIEQTNGSQEEFGIKRVIKTIREAGNLPMLEVGRRILEEIKKFRGKEPQHDDITGILIKYTA